MTYLQFDAWAILAEHRKTVAAVANTVAAESLVAEDCSNNSNCSRDNTLQNLIALEKELADKEWLYGECVGFEYRPFPRQLDPACKSAGQKAISQLENDIANLKVRIQCLRNSLKGYEP